MVHRFGVPAILGLGLLLGCGGNDPVQPNATNDRAAAASPGAPQNSEQVIFSGLADINNSFGSPVGFWIWCMAEGEHSPYEGECNGAMYFYDLGITRHVEGEVEESEEEEGVYVMTVSSTRDDAIIGCVLTNGLPVNHGPSNFVKVECGTPAGSAESHDAVVNVTGPPEE
jgi:hypothetical protein